MSGSGEEEFDVRVNVPPCCKHKYEKEIQIKVCDAFTVTVGLSPCV